MSRANFLPTDTYSCIMCGCESDQKFTFEHLSNKHNIYFLYSIQCPFCPILPSIFWRLIIKNLFTRQVFIFIFQNIANKTTNYLQLVDISTSQVVYYIIDKTSTYAEKQKYGE